MLNNYNIFEILQAANGHEECVDALLHNQADVNSRYVLNLKIIVLEREQVYSNPDY